MATPGKCLKCGIPAKTEVCMSKLESGKWALDTDLASEYPEAWGKPINVRISSLGLCPRCRSIH